MPLYASVSTDELIKAYRGFEPNYGQVQDFDGRPVKDIIFSTRAPGLNLFFKHDGVSYVIYSEKNEEIIAESKSINPEKRSNKEAASTTEYARIDLELVGGRIDKSNIVFEDELPGYVNYYLPSCPDGIKEVKTYRVVRVKDVYPNIDWVFRYDADGNLHHDFVVKPEGDPERIRLKFKWADVKLREDGSEVILSTPVGEILDGSIYAYEGYRKVKVSYVIDDGVLAYDVRNWRRQENLVIDPPLARLWATYYGGGSSDYAYSVCIDPQGNVYVEGETSSINFPVYNPGGGAYYQGSNAGNSDAFILKFEGTSTPIISESASNPAFNLAVNGMSVIASIKVPSSCELKFALYDVTGRSVFGPITKVISAGETKYEISIPTPDIYFYEVETPYAKVKGKVVIMK